MTASDRPDIAAIEPSVAVRGMTDARVLLALWGARRAFFPLLCLGLVIASVVIIVVRNVGVDEFTTELERVSDEGNLLPTLLSPFAGIAFALVWRIGVAWVALATTYPLARRHRMARSADRTRLSYAFRSWWDRWFLMRSYRAMRWTWAVRVEAATTDPRAGRIADVGERVLRWSGWALLAGVVVVWIVAA